jgi:hypothetical protein
MLDTGYSMPPGAGRIDTVFLLATDFTDYTDLLFLSSQKQAAEGEKE